MAGNFDYKKKPEERPKATHGMMQVIDCLFPGVKEVHIVEPFEELTEGGVTYIRFNDGDDVVQLLRKTVVEGGSTKRYKAMAAWNDRESAEWIPINQSFPVQDK